MYEGDTSGLLSSSTWYVYGQPSDPPSWNLAPNSKGELRGVRRYAGPNQFVDTRYGYDSYGNVTTETVYNSYGTTDAWASTAPRTTTTDYDIAHHVLPIQITGPEVGNYTPIETREYYEVNESDTTGYGLPGQLKRVRDANNQDDTWYEYDVFGRQTKIARPGDSLSDPTQQFVYYDGEDIEWGAGPRTMVASYQKVDSEQPKLWTRRFYDGLGRLVQTQTAAEDWMHQGNGVTSGHDIVQYRTYDALGGVAKESLPYEVDSYDAVGTPLPSPYRTPGSEAGTTHTYDALGRPVRSTHPDNTWTEHHYGLWGSNLWYDDVIDENRHLKGYVYDSLGRMVTVLDTVGTCGLWGYSCGPGETAWSISGTTNYDYDVRDNLTEVTDPLGNVTTMAYNLLGRKTGMHDPDMGNWSYGHDAVGNLTAQIDAKGQTITFQYDALNRLTKKDYPSGSDVYYKYDNYKADAPTKNSWGRLRVMYSGTESGNGHLYEYDNRGRPVKEQVKVDGVTYSTSYAYDAADRVVTTIYPNGEAVAVEYNPQGLPETLTGADTYVTGASYTARGQTDLLQLGEAGLDLQVKYDYYTDDRRLQRLRAGTASVPGRDLDMRYTYDDVGNVTQIDDVRNGQTQYQIFGYDALDRLTSAATSGAGTWGSYSESYTYNAIGNMTSKDGVSYTYPASGPSSVRPHAVTGTSNGGAFSYDTNGNMTSRRDKTGDPTYSQVWDYENRLVSVTANGQTTTFTYDGDGALVKR